jgi:hypothetical protein
MFRINPQSRVAVADEDFVHVVMMKKRLTIASGFFILSSWHYLTLRSVTVGGFSKDGWNRK